MTTFQPSPLQKSIGLTNSLTFEYQTFRSDAKLNRQINPQNQNPNEKSVARQSLLNEMDGQVHIEFNQRKLPPAWVDTYDQITENLQSAARKNNQIKQLQKERLNITWGDTSAKDKEINSLSQEVSDIFKTCDKLLMHIKDIEGIDKELKKNIQKSMACQLKECATNFRKQQSEYVHKIKQIQGEETQQNYIAYEDELEETQELFELKMISRVRDEGINKLIDTINDLASLFKDLKIMVIEQGTILDRIDFNIELAVKDTEQANVQLKKALDYQKSSRSICCIMILIVLISAFGVLLIFKHSK